MKKNIKYIVLSLCFLIVAFYFLTNGIFSICTYILGSDRSLYPKSINHSVIDDNVSDSHYIRYNNGKRMVRKSINLSILEIREMYKNNGKLKFKVWKGHITHRSEFIFYLIIFSLIIAFSTWILYLAIKYRK